MYFYHGYALGVASTVPGNECTQAVCALSVRGGSGDTTETKSACSLISFDSIKSHVEGSESSPYGADGPDSYVTKASLVIENLKIKDKTNKDRVTAGHIEAHLVSQHLEGNYEASTVIAGSQFTNVAIDGTAITIETSKLLSNPYSTYSTMQTGFKDTFNRKEILAQLIGRDLDATAAKTPDLIAAYQAYQEQDGMTCLKPLVICSLVKKTTGGGFDRWGPIIAIPGFGNLYLGEVMVWSWMRCLTMFRLELLDEGGTISGGSVGAGGGTFPPGATGGGGTAGGGG